MHQFKFLIFFNRLHQGIGDPDGDVEVAQVALILGADEFLDVGMVAAQYAHLRAAPRACRFNCFAGAVEHAHVGDRPAGAGVGAFDLSAFGADGRKIIAHSAAAPHGFGGLLQGIVNAGFAVRDAGNRIAHRLHETVDQRCLHFQASRRVDAPGGDEAVFLCREKDLLPMGALIGGFGQRESARHAAAHVLNAGFVGFGVFFQQDFDAYFLGHDSFLVAE